MPNFSQYVSINPPFTLSLGERSAYEYLSLNNLQVKILFATLDEDCNDANEERHEAPGSHPLRDPCYMVPPRPAQTPGQL